MEQNKYGAPVAYEYGRNLYINVTNQCCNACDFCLRQNSPGSLYADNLWYQGGRTHQGGNVGGPGAPGPEPL